MKNFLFVVLLSALGWAQAAAPKPVANLNDSDNAHKARALLDQAIQALGGQAYLTYQNKGEQGRYYPLYHGRTNTAGIAYNYYIQYPDKDRFEVIHLQAYHFFIFDVNNVQLKDKSDIVVIHNGLKGYETTYKGTAAQDPEDLANYLRRRQHSLEWVFRKWSSDPGVALFSDGVAVVDAKATDQVTLLNSQNDSVTVYLDQNTHLPIKASFSWRDPTDKQKNTEEEIYDLYKPVDGIMTPHSITRNFNGEMSMQRFINTVKYNLKLPESTFEATVNYDPKQGPKKR
ncbi:MAG: hypothetical protein LAO22_20205 [Acidobacteriia bacterium]|nr:hypothetical protein [Terriglobia bacterium]